ncbi:hypothetical protein FKP32DRAFT_1106657 [Trametes sanguinea]|nr:hypothetical protein FKP32DRAFT_1106657 [Trametes sanguinea]
MRSLPSTPSPLSGVLPAHPLCLTRASITFPLLLSSSRPSPPHPRPLFVHSSSQDSLSALCCVCCVSALRTPGVPRRCEDAVPNNTTRNFPFHLHRPQRSPPISDSQHHISITQYKSCFLLPSSEPSLSLPDFLPAPTTHHPSPMPSSLFSFLALPLYVA